MKKLLILFISILIFNCSGDDSNNDNPPENSVICERAISIDVYLVSENSAGIGWVTEVSGETIPSSWVVEIGSQGFAPGTGTTYNTSSNYFDFNNLNPSTSYDVYIKSKCGSNVFGDNVGPISFTTEGVCTTPSNLNLYTVDTCGFGVDWYGENESAWEIEFGESGFTLGTGTVISTSNTDYYINTDISPNTTYEVYVRANCGSQGYSNYTNAIVVTTDPLTSDALSGYFVGNYAIQDVTATVGPSNSTENFETGTVTLSVHPTDPNKRIFNANILPAFIFSSHEITLDFNMDMTVDMSNVNTTLSCNSGASNLIFTSAGSGNSSYDPCNDDYILVTYIEDANASCGGPYTSSFSLTKL